MFIECYWENLGEEQVGECQEMTIDNKISEQVGEDEILKHQ